jgi:hypothetical protein
MLKKILLPLLFLIIVNNCDYSPVYLKGENTKLNINIIEVEGDTEINKVITNEISEIANNSYAKVINIKINTNYIRTTLARNTKGTPTDFELKATSRFEVTNPNKEQNFTIEEKFNYKKMSNSYEQSNYEKTLKKNLASSITRKLILRLNITE